MIAHEQLMNMLTRLHLTAIRDQLDSLLDEAARQELTLRETLAFLCQREIARKGGESVPSEKRSFSQNHELAAEAGRKGGGNVPNEKRSFSQDPALAAQAGRKGGQASSGNFANDRERAARAGRKGGQSSGSNADD